MELDDERLFRESVELFNEIKAGIKPDSSNRDRADYLTDKVYVLSLCSSLCLAVIDDEKSVNKILKSSLEKSLWLWKQLKNQRAADGAR